MKEADIRQHVHKQRRFYKSAVELALINAVLILIWLLFDTGHHFWPKYVILISLIDLAIKGYHYGLFPLFADKFQIIKNKMHFMSEEWEEDKVNEMMGNTKPESKKEPPKKTAKKPASPQKKVVARTKKPSSK